MNCRIYLCYNSLENFIFLLRLPKIKKNQQNAKNDPKKQSTETQFRKITSKFRSCVFTRWEAIEIEHNYAWWFRESQFYLSATIYKGIRETITLHQENVQRVCYNSSNVWIRYLQRKTKSKMHQCDPSESDYNFTIIYIISIRFTLSAHNFRAGKIAIKIFYVLRVVCFKQITDFYIFGYFLYKFWCVGCVWDR